LSRAGCAVAASAGAADAPPRQAAYWRRISVEASDGDTAAAASASGIRSTAPEWSTFMLAWNACGFAW